MLGRGLSYEFTYDELRGDDPAFEVVRDAIREGARHYSGNALMRNEARSFEQWFIGSRDFRKYVIPYLAAAPARIDPGEYGSADIMREAKAAVSSFKFEQSDRKALAAAERRWRRLAERLTLPAVDLRSGALLPDETGRIAAAA